MRIKTKDLDKDGLKDRARAILKGDEGTMTETQFKEYIIEWLGLEMIVDLFFDTWDRTDGDSNELLYIINKYESND